MGRDDEDFKFKVGYYYNRVTDALEEFGEGCENWLVRLTFPAIILATLTLTPIAIYSCSKFGNSKRPEMLDNTQIINNYDANQDGKLDKNELSNLLRDYKLERLESSTQPESSRQ